MTHIDDFRGIPRVLGLVLLLVSLWAFARFANAHALGQGYVFLQVGEASLDGWIEITLVDLDRALGIDENRDGKVDAREADANLDRIKAYVAKRVGIGSLDETFGLRFTTHTYRRVPLGQYIALSFEIDGVERVPIVYRIHYSMLFDVDPQHRGFLVVSSNALTGDVNTGEETSLVFAPDRQTQRFDLESLSAWRSFGAFVGHGIWHILIGFDHVLFLLALIITAVLIRESGTWRPLESMRSAMWNLVKIITLFTLAHTITLTLASFGVVNVPSRLVESVIALSVVAAAFNNVYPIFGRRIGWLVFCFGLFHGFGFASVLTHLMKTQSNLVVNLLGFNIGVEIGQLLIIAVVFPLLFALRRMAAYSKAFVPAGSMVIALLALAWFVERALDIDVMPI